MTSSPELSVVIMAYNEQQGLPVTVAEVLEVLEGYTFEVLIVDDGITDQTETIARQLESSHPEVRHVPHPVNLGLGGVYRTGFAQAGGEWLTFLPADGELPPSNLLEFLSRREGHDLLLGES